MTPKIEKTEEFDLTTNCDKLPQSFSTPNCEICKDYPKEYWCGNPKNKLSLKEQEVSKKILELEAENTIKEVLIRQQQKLLSSLQEKIEDWIKRNKTSWEYLKKHGFPEAKEYGDCIFLNYKLSFPESLSAEEELQKIIKEMGE